MALNISNSSNVTEDLILETKFKTLFEVNFYLAVGYVIIVFVLSIVGVCGNTLIIYIMYMEKKMNKHARAFIINMAIADLCVTGIADPMCIVGAFIGLDVLESVPVLCVATASLCLTVCFCVFLNMLSLTVNRCIYICYNETYSKIYNMKRVAVMCAGCWIVAITMEIGNFAGWGGHYFDPKSHQCIWDRTASRSYTLFVSFVLITSPLLIIAYCNVAMIRKVLSVKTKQPATKESSWKMMNASLSTARTLLAMFIVFLICWTPYVAVICIDQYDEMSMEAHLFVTLLAHTHSSVICLVYIIFKKKFRDYVKRLFCCQSAVGPMLFSTDEHVGTGTTRTEPISRISSHLTSSKTNM